MNLAAYFQDALSANLYVVDTGLATDGTLNDGNPLIPDADSWNYGAETVNGLIPAYGSAISPDGTKIAIVAANAALNQYKIQVWDVGSTPDVASTLDGPNKIYLVNATKIKEYTKSNASTSTPETIPTAIFGGADQDINHFLNYGVLDLQVSNDGDLWWLEAENSDGTFVTPPGGVFSVNVVGERFWRKAHVQELLFADSSPTNLGTFLTRSSASPQSLGFDTGFPLLPPGGFEPIQIDALWDGPRARVIGRARSSLSETICWYNGVPGGCEGTGDNIVNDYATALVKDGIFEPAEIVNRTSLDTEDGPDFDFTYLDQVPTEVLRDSADSLLWAADYHTFAGAASGKQISNVRRTALGITGVTQRLADVPGNTARMFFQDADGAVSLLTVVDGLADTELGFWGIGVGGYNNTQLYPVGALLGADRKYVVDLNWQLREASLAGSVMTIEAAIEVVSPDNPDGVDYDNFIRSAVVGGGGTSLGGVGGSRTFFPTATVSG